MLELLRSLVQAATPFMQHQANPNHFEFLGLDVIADRKGGVWLMEGETRTYFCRTIDCSRVMVPSQAVRWRAA